MKRKTFYNNKFIVSKDKKFITQTMNVYRRSLKDTGKLVHDGRLRQVHAKNKHAVMTYVVYIT